MFKKALFSICLIFGLTLPQSILATDSNSKAQTYEGDLIIRDLEINLEDDISGDLIAVGGKIKISGEIDGDVYIVGENIELSGKFNNDIYVLGNSVLFNGSANRSLNIWSLSTNIAQTAKLSGNLNVRTQDFSYRGNSSGNLDLQSSSSKLSGLISGNLNIESQNLSFDKDFFTEGKITYQTPQEISIPNPKISADQFIHVPPKFNLDFTNYLGSFVAQIVVGLLIMYFLPLLTTQVALLIGQRPGRSFIVGIAAIFIGSLFSFTIIAALLFGTPLPIQAFLIIPVFYGLIWLSSLSFFAIWLGNFLLYLLKAKANRYIGFILGITLCYLLFLIPVLGEIISTMIQPLVFGAFATIIWKRAI